MSARVLVVCGTRPEAIKLAPVVRALTADARFTPLVAVTAQHRELLDQALGLFRIRPDYDLDLMRPDQDLYHVTSETLLGMRGVLADAAPDLVVVQGDTTTTFATALSCFYEHIPVAHVEAGLRSGDPFSPFPEEQNRVLTSRLAAHHFAPTERAREHLLHEGVPAAAIHVTGNTVVDALLEIAATVRESAPPLPEELATLDPSRRLVLVTAHRRESFGRGMRDVCLAVSELARRHPALDLVFPVHPNPNVRVPAARVLGDRSNVRLVAPVDYAQLVWLMTRAHLVLTDSGGIQEEVASLSVPALVLRETTERPEGVEAGGLRLVGTSKTRIVEETEKLLADPELHARMTAAPNPFGDGRASERIRDILARELVREAA
ncbi:MAG: non-hydrolyzing UDP-N-acetylglucosamine 2-epimerase [Gaiellaceae bacterium]